MPALPEPVDATGAASPPVMIVEDMPPPDDQWPDMVAASDQEIGTIVHYHFPVEIEVRAAPETADPSEAARLAMQWLTDGLHSL
jgi:hypothetical protein